jgi:L-ribulose-5-phosphate 3-epimerase
VRPTRLAVCSWSLQPASVDELVERVMATGLVHVQLALDPVRLGVMDIEPLRRRFDEAGLGAISGMMAMDGEDYSTLDSIRRTGGVVPDETWPANLAAAAELARIADELRLPLVTFHAGFIPDSTAEPGRAVTLERIRALRDVFAARGVRVALETGQETADTLARVLLELDGVDVNFDPANMILYGKGDPIEALRRLLPRVAQVHIKDARPADRPEEWGTEVPVGTGAVDWPAFTGVLRERPVDRVIEREAGTNRAADVRTAADLLRGLANGA